jgi:hypothetical protein
MPANRKHFFRFDLWLDPVFDEHLPRDVLAPLCPM